MKRDDTRYVHIYDAGYEQGRRDASEELPAGTRVHFLFFVAALCAVAAAIATLRGDPLATLMAGFLFLGSIIATVGAIAVWPER